MAPYGRVARMVILSATLAITATYTDTAAARPGAFGFGHARSGWASAARPSWSRAYPRSAPESRAYGAYSRWPPSSSTPPRQGTDAPRASAWGTGSRDRWREQRPIQADHRYAHDYRQVHAENGGPGGAGINARTPAPVPPPYLAGLPAAGYGTAASGNAFSVAGLLAQIVSAFAQDLLDGEMYGADSSYPAADFDAGYDDAER